MRDPDEGVNPPGDLVIAVIAELSRS